LAGWLPGLHRWDRDDAHGRFANADVIIHIA